MAASRPTQSPAPVQATGFAELGVPPMLVESLAAAGITSPFPIQSATLPDSLAGRDVLGRGRTGSGKTYAFLLPLVARLAGSHAARGARKPRALVLAPTRELASQIEAALAPLAKVAGLRTLTIFGGVRPNPQIAALRSGVDVVIACPGRLEDHLRSGHADLSGIEITVLDEADHMADLGFLPVVRRILDRTPGGSQRLLFSATLDAGVDVLVKRYLSNPVVHSVDTAQSPISTMTHHVLHVEKDSRLSIITDLASAPGRTVLFTRTKRGAKTLARQLNARGVPAVELHGDLSQNARTRNLASFSSGSATTLVATDIAARGIHIDDVGLVVHADPPVEHKAYLHRSGRTARAGADGTVVTMMLDAQVSDVRDLTRKAGIKPTITRVQPGHPVLTVIAPGERRELPPVETVVVPQAGRGGSGSERPAGTGTRRRRSGGAGRGNGAGNGGAKGSTGQGGSGRSQGSSAGRSQASGGAQGGGRPSRPAAAAGSGRPHSAANFSSASRTR
ncbi:DEAD/DEAH box helicase [Nocardioides mesophilus]|uniref:DEAD/DEAH box helicase n=1 Tax=Nocardioides mesophilus TaxID=433659 RepID=A0A7G9R7V6_9ACTN|nr:DEAD/DEAH box helicase [Nocardioides mesophilus]QNN51681.1 DEAD/DEAH box helicase [Nocardioides mesophilus]